MLTKIIFILGNLFNIFYFKLILLSGAKRRTLCFYDRLWSSRSRGVVLPSAFMNADWSNIFYYISDILPLYRPFIPILIDLYCFLYTFMLRTFTGFQFLVYIDIVANIWINRLWERRIRIRPLLKIRVLLTEYNNIYWFTNFNIIYPQSTILALHSKFK